MNVSSRLNHVCSNRELFDPRSIPAMGYSFSAMKAVLRAAIDEYFVAHGKPDLAAVARRALHLERIAADGLPVAANDVTPIVFGGALAVHTSAESRQVSHVRIECDPDWWGSFLVWAYRPSGVSHHVPGLLRRLVEHGAAADYVAQISDIARTMIDAAKLHDIEAVASHVNEYRQLFFEGWGQGELIHPDTRCVAERLNSTFGSDFLGWKPPGAGAASSIVCLVRNPIAVCEFLRTVGWVAEVASLTCGLRMKPASQGNGVQFSCGGRIDLVGAADLGMCFGADGVCVSLAVGPRSRLLVDI